MIDHEVGLIYRYDDNQSRRSLLKALETRPEIRIVWGNLALCDFDIGVECYSLPFYFLEWVSRMMRFATEHFNLLVKKKDLKF